MKKLIISLIVILSLAIVGGGVYYWYFFILNPNVAPIPTNISISDIFSPFNNAPVTTSNEPVVTQPVDNSSGGDENTIVVDNVPVFSLPKLRQISKTPVAGFFASSTASTSIVRYMDRGTGHLYEADDTSNDIRTLSNTTLPKIYEAYGNKNGNGIIIRYLKDDNETVSNFYTELRSTGTSTSQTPYELKGKYLSPEISQLVVSPSGDKVFTWNIENGSGQGYISGLDEKGKTKIYSSPLTQVNVDWPETNTIVLSTKASSIASGYIYSINTKTGDLSTIIGNYRGLSGKMNRDGSKILVSAIVNSNIVTSIRNIKDSINNDLLFKTLSEKCVWSNVVKTDLYCAVPSQIPTGAYPDDWYRGRVSFIDQIWHVDTKTGETHQLANLLELSNSRIDAINLTLDPKENTLYFINKEDLSLWALDLKQ
jgi:hypothetical protein